MGARGIGLLCYQTNAMDIQYVPGPIQGRDTFPGLMVGADGPITPPLAVWTPLQRSEGAADRDSQTSQEKTHTPSTL